MNSRILWTVLLSAFAGVAWAKEIDLNSQTFVGKTARILEDGNTYVVRGDVRFEGGSRTGESGLTVADGAYVRIRIEKGGTLTCIGGSGASAGSGADGVSPIFEEKTVKAYDYESWDFSYKMPQFSLAAKASGGSGGGGGGAGIEVPQGSTLTICGEGELKASGGAGGTGNSGGNGAFGRYRALTIHTSQRIGDKKELGSEDYSQTNKLNWTEDYSKPSGSTYTRMCYSDRDAQPASGGSGGGGSGGGGAGLGSRGANGGSGGDGGAVTNIWHNGKRQSAGTAGLPMDSDACVMREGGEAASSNVSPAPCGRIVLEGGVSVDARGGDGGANEPWEQKLNPSNVVQFVDWRCGDDGTFVRDLQANIYFTEGQHGGSGGKGGNGAAYGTGGGGGGGGGGGDSGSVSGDNHASEMPASNFGDEGGTGADGNPIVPIIPVGFFVNGEDVVLGTGPGWAYDVKEKILTLNSAMTYVLSGAAMNNEVQVHAAVSSATAVLSNAVVFASGRPAVKVEQGATLTAAANQVMMTGESPEALRYAETCGNAPCVLAVPFAPVTPGTPIGPFTTAVAATNAMAKAVLNPRDDVTAKLGAGSSALGTYCDMFGFAVTGGGETWFVEAELYPQAWSNVMESAQAATRQIPVRDIAALPLNTPTNVTAKGCGMPGFYYSFYSGGAVTNLGAVAAEKGRNVLCGTDRDVEFSGVVKPSDAAGFFTIGVKEAPSVTPSDRAELEPPAITDVKTAGD